LRPIRPVPANAAILESGRDAGESLSAIMGGEQPFDIAPESVLR
jgi:hypothetical protein